MKPINFITTLSAKQHFALRRWWHVTLVVFFGLLTSIMLLQSIQLYAFYKAISEHRYMQEQSRLMHSELEPYTALKKEEEVLRAQRAKIDHIYHTTERLRMLLASLHVTDQSVYLQSCKLDKTSFELIIQCANTEFALNEIKRLRTEKQLHQIQLVSLQQAKKDASMIATIKGKIHNA